MKKIILAAILAFTSSALLQAQSMEQLRRSSENMDINAGSLKNRSTTAQYEIVPTKYAEVSNPIGELIAAIFKLLFGANGDIEISNPRTDVPVVEGTLQDDDFEENYVEGYSYQTLNPEEYQDKPAVEQPQRPQNPGVGGAGNGGVVPADLKRKALEYFNSNSDKIQNKRYIGIVDFAEHSSRARFYIMDMQSGNVRAIRVAHGSGSDPDGDGYATKFSNVPNSKASSLGVYITGALYNGKHGKSMRLHGISSTNSNALSRAVVVHESAYVQEANMRQGRSFGCLAVASTEIRNVLASLNGGAMIYAGLSNSEF